MHPIARRNIQRFLGRVFLTLILAAIVLYIVDWAVWRVRIARGSGMGSVHVTWFQVAGLKGGKQEFYPDGEGSVDCSLSVLPQGGAKPCWYLTEHPVIFIK